MKIFICFVLMVLALAGRTYGLNKTEDCSCPITSGFPRLPNRSWLVTIHSSLVPGKENLTVCQATILNEQHVLTSASCVPMFEEHIEHMKIKIPGKKEFLNVTGVFVHPKYERKIFRAQNDIAIVRLKAPIEFDVNTRPACLYEKKKFQIQLLNVAAFGAKTAISINNETGTISGFVPNPKMKEVVVNIKMPVNTTQCENSKVICINNMMGKPHSICLQDVGAPIHVKEKKKYVAGIIGLMAPKTVNDTVTALCERTRNPTRVARVAEYLDFIRAHVNEEFCT